MNKADKATAEFAESAIVAGIVAGIVVYAACRLHDNWRIQRREPDRCILPAIEAGLQAGIERMFGPISLPVQAGINYVLRDPDLYDEYGRAYYLRLPHDPGQWWE